MFTGDQHSLLVWREMSSAGAVVLVWWLRYASLFMFLVMVLFFIFWELLSAVAIWGHLSKLRKTENFGCGDSAMLERNGLVFVLGWGVEFLILSLPGEKTELSHCNWYFPWWKQHKRVWGDMEENIQFLALQDLFQWEKIHFHGLEDQCQWEKSHFDGLEGQCRLIRGDDLLVRWQSANPKEIFKWSETPRSHLVTDNQAQAQQLCWSFHLSKMTRVLSQLFRYPEKFPV